MPHTETMLESKEIFNGRVIRVTLDTVRLEMCIRDRRRRAAP